MERDLNEYIKSWNTIIMNCSFDNTYKMAWAKALVDLSIDINEECPVIEISFEQVARKCLKYYWNQTIYFDLVQGSNHKKIPEILTYTKELIEKYFTLKSNTLPIQFERVETQLEGNDLKNDYENTLLKVVRTLKQDVCWRFKNIGKETLDIYDIDIKEGTIFIKKEHMKLLKDHSELLFQVINYRWTQMLETFNSSPKIAMKVRATHEIDGVKRKDLKPFHKYLDLEFEDVERYCFHCGQSIDRKDLSVDHIIP